MDAEVVIAGGYSVNEIATSNKCHVSELLISHQEEADTRLLSHVHITNAGRHGYEHVFFNCRDTDAVSFLVLYNGDLQIPEKWLVAGTQLKRWYIPIQNILIGLEPNVRSNLLLAFHAMTGCGTTSQFVGHGKRTAWKTFLDDERLDDE